MRSAVSFSGAARVVASSKVPRAAPLQFRHPANRAETSGRLRSPSYSTLPAFLCPPPWLSGGSGSTSSAGFNLAEGSSASGGVRGESFSSGSSSFSQSRSSPSPYSSSPSSSAAEAGSSSKRADQRPRPHEASSLADFFSQNAARHKPKSLFPHPKRSIDAIAGFREAISSRDVGSLAAAYDELVDAFHAHRQHLRDVAARWQVDVPIRHPRHDFQIRKADLQTAVKTILRRPQRDSASGRRLQQHEAQLARRILHDIKVVFGLGHGASDIHYHLWTYCDESPKSGSYLDPVEAFDALRAMHPTWRTTEVDWNLVLKALCRRKDLDRAQRLVRDMEDQGIERSVKVRNSLASLYFSLGLVDEAEQQLQQIGDSSEMQIDTLTVALNGYCMALGSCGEGDGDGFEGQRRHFARMAQSYATLLRSQLSNAGPGSSDKLAWAAVLRCEAMMAGPDAAFSTVRQWTRPGALSARVASHLLMLHERELAELQTSDEALALVRRIEAIDPTGKLRFDRVGYSVLIASLLGRPPRPKRWTSPLRQDEQAASVWAGSSDGDGVGSVDEAFDVDGAGKALPNPNQIREGQLLYDHLLATGVKPDAAMITPLVFAYCDAFLPSLPSAMKLMDDVLRHAQAKQKAQARTRSHSHSQGAAQPVLDTELFNALLRGCAKIKDVGTARALLRQMVLHGIRVDETSKVQAASVMMRCSSSWEEAFEMYRGVRRLGCSAANDGSDGLVAQGYSAKGYTTLLDVYRKLQLPALDGESSGSAGTNGCAPSEYVLAILDDMREAGHRPSCATYTSLLDYYGKSPRPSYADVYATHELMKQDEDLEPDLPLINALMNAYNRVGEPGQVASIWNNLMANRQKVDGATLAIVLDTAGRNGMLLFARKALAAVRRLETERWLGSHDVDDQGRGSGNDRTVRRRRTAINKGAWDAWIECLARCGRLEEAVEFVFGTMTKQLLRDAHDAGTELMPTVAGQPVRDAHGRIVGPDVKTVQMLLKFAAAQRDRLRAKHRQRDVPRASSSSSILLKRWTTMSTPQQQQQQQQRKQAVQEDTIRMTAEEERLGGSIWHDVRARVKEEMGWLWEDVKMIGLP